MIATLNWIEFSAMAIGHHAANQGEKKDGNTAENLIQRQQKRRVTEPVNQPTLGHNLHPGTDAGCAAAKSHQTEIAILKCLKNPPNHLDVSERRLTRSFTRAR